MCSASLNDSQNNYMTIEIEMQAVLLACEKFGFYLRYAEATTLWTENAEMVGAAKKDFTLQRSPRLCLMFEKVLPYNLIFRNIEGKDNSIADCFTCLCSSRLNEGFI